MAPKEKKREKQYEAFMFCLLLLLLLMSLLVGCDKSQGQKESSCGWVPEASRGVCGLRAVVVDM